MSITSLSSKTGRATCRVIDYSSQLPHNAKLISLCIAGSEVFVKNATDVFVWICKKMTLYRTQRLRAYIRKRKASWIKCNRNEMGKPYQIVDNCFVDLNVTDREALQRASLLLQGVLWPRKDAIITYEQPSKEVVKPVQNRGVARAHSERIFDAKASPIIVTNTSVSLDRQSLKPEEPLQKTKIKTVVPPPFYEYQIAKLLESEFSNGVRLDFIGRNKVLKLYRQRYGSELPGNLDLDSTLSKIGILHDGKVYPRTSSKSGGWRKLIERLVEQGHTIFQFSRVMELHASEFMQMGIVSSEMLRETMLREAQDAYEIFEELFASTDMGTVDERLASIVTPQEEAIIDISAVSRRMPYVEEAIIRNHCKNQKGLINNTHDSYAIVARINFDDREVTRGCAQCETAIEADGFFSLSQLSLEDSVSMNDPRLTDNALRRSFFRRFLSERFDIHGQVVCARGAKMEGQFPLRFFLRNRTDLSLEQLRNVAKDYHIAFHIALKTTHEEMVRVERERFVAPTQIMFDVPLIDLAISDICDGCCMPFGAFTNLSDFPAVPGYSWNDFLLEAFLRRASKAFCLVSPSVPAIGVSGVVVPSSDKKRKAEETFAIMALRCDIPAEAEDVKRFLVAKRCVLNSSTTLAEMVVAKMKELDCH